MERNLSAPDRFVRLSVGAALMGLALFVARGWVRLLLGLASAALLASGVVGACHLYKVCGIRTSAADS